MIQAESSRKTLKWLAALLLSASLYGCGGGGDDLNSGGHTDNSGGQPDQGPPPTAAGVGTGAGGNGRGPAPLNLGGSANYTILSVKALTNQPTSVVTGNVGLTQERGSRIQLTCGEVSGQIFTMDDSGPPCRIVNANGLLQDERDADDAYLDAMARTPDYSEFNGGDVGGRNLGPATYYWSTGVTIPANLTLTGGPNDVWIFQIAQGLNVEPGVRIILEGGALPQNIFWVPMFTADLGANSQFKGIVLPAAPVFMRTGASINGKLLAYAVHLDQNIVGP